MKPHNVLALNFFIALGCIASASASAADSVVEDPTTAMARARFVEGVDFYDRGEFEKARASFLQAYALKKHPAVLLNLAWSCLKAKHPLEADHYFRELLAEGNEINDKQRADANDGLNQTRAKLGRIEVASGGGTQITLDGEPVGTAPLAEAISAEAGVHVLEARAPDGTVEAQTVTVLAGEQVAARFRTAPAPVNAGVEARAEGAATTFPPLEGTPKGHETVERDAVQPGPVATPPRRPDRASVFPVNMAPVYLGSALTIAGAGLAIAMLELKQTAQTNADTTRANVEAQHRRCPTEEVGTQLSSACDAYATDNRDVNTDATIGNVAMIAGAAALAGTIVYWAAATKAHDPAPSAALRIPRLKVAPWVAPATRGFMVFGDF